MGALCSAVGLRTSEIGGADTRERVERAGGSSRIFEGVGSSDGLADLLRWTRPPFGVDASLDGAITSLIWIDVEKIKWVTLILSFGLCLNYKCRSRGSRCEDGEERRNLKVDP